MSQLPGEQHFIYLLSSPELERAEDGARAIKRKDPFQDGAMSASSHRGLVRSERVNQFPLALIANQREHDYWISYFELGCKRCLLAL